jgi:hypothetical protein
MHATKEISWTPNRANRSLKDDPELLVFGSASPPIRLHYLKTPNLGTDLISVHKDSYQQRASPGLIRVKGRLKEAASIRTASSH